MKKTSIHQSLVTDSSQSGGGLYQSNISNPFKRKSPNILNDEQYINCWKVAEAFLGKHGSIRNKQIREAAKINYDQAINFFNRALSEKRLIRLGVASGTHYVLKGTPAGRRTKR